MMRICNRCIQPDTRPGIYFDDQGVCGACLWEEKKKEINWKSREKELRGYSRNGLKKQQRVTMIV